jgi:hypothetical protein
MHFQWRSAARLSIADVLSEQASSSAFLIELVGRLAKECCLAGAYMNEATKCSRDKNIDRFPFLKAGNIKPNLHYNANIQYASHVTFGDRDASQRSRSPESTVHLDVARIVAEDRDATPLGANVATSTPRLTTSCPRVTVHFLYSIST